ncbi:MAG: S8 family serine peptidase [Anaerolineae bacterium]|nr:S8 family serine peptidase [Anaerolineae bacterium]
MARRLPFLVVLVALVVPLALAGQPAVVLAADDAPPAKALKEQLPDELNTYIVTLEFPALARYRGGIEGLAGTSNAVTGAAKLDANSPASQAYLAFLAERRADFLRRASERLGREIEVGHIYEAVLNGFSARLTPDEATRLADMPGLKSIAPRERRELLTDRGPQWIGAPSAWGSATACAPGGNCGEGMIVGVVDSGINMDHPSFADIGGDGYNHSNPLGAGNYKGWCNPTHPNYDNTLVCNDKLIGVYSYPSSGMDPEDDDGHGSHTASTAAGNRLPNVVLSAPTIGLNFAISGVAPHANIIAYDACDGGCNNDDLVAALDQAALDGVDALNYSISGTTQSPWVAADEQAFLGLREAGAFVSASAGNSGPGPQTVAHGSPWLTTTAASTHDRALINAAINLTSSNGPLADIYGRSVTSSLAPTPIVYAGNVNNNPLCLAGVWSASALAGKLVVCDRGNNARVEKADNVKAAGGLGMILVNAASNGDEEIGDAYAIPGVHITYSEGVTLKNWLASGSGHQGGILGTVNDIDPNNGDVMAAFSSRGPNIQVPDLIKPDMTAPGVDILAAYATLQGEPVPELEIISGTSMSSPHMAGAGALMMKAKYPTWSVSEIQSAMMTTSVWDNSVRKEDTATPTDPFDRGAGRVNIANALNAGLVLNINDPEYTAANPATGGDPKTLNYPSMADDNCYKSCGWTRTVRNTLNQAVNWSGQFIGKDGLVGTLTVPNFTINAGGTQQIGLNITDVSGLTPGNWYFGHVVYTAQGNVAPQFHMPVAIRVSGSTDASMIEKTVTPTSAAAGANPLLDYTVTIRNTAEAVRTFNLQDPVPSGATYVSETGDWSYSGGILSWNGTLPAAVPTAEARGTSSSYTSLAAAANAQAFSPPSIIGATLLTGVDLPYFGTVYGDLTICRDGMVIPVPAGSLANCGTPNAKLPNTGIPQNAIAPWWDTLEYVTNTSQWYFDLQRLNGREYVIIEWENFRIRSTSTYLTFQAWMALDGSDIFFAYKPGFNPGANPSATVGFENSDGTKGASYYFRGTSGTAEGTVPNGTYDVWVGLKPGLKTFGFKATATAPANSNITNEATVTVSSTTNTALANTRICGPATAAQPTISAQSRRYAFIQWTADMHNSYELWRSTSPYVVPGAPGSVKVYSGKASSFVDQPNVTVGDPATNFFYVLRTLNCAGAAPADALGVAAFDFGLTPGN